MNQQMNVGAGIRAGIHDFGPEAYFRDPAPAPSLTSRGIRLLLPPECPAVFAARHPRLSPHWATSRPSASTTASATTEVLVRLLLLGRESEVEVIDAPDFQSKGAQALKKLALRDGKLPTLRHLYDNARSIADDAMLQLVEGTKVGRWPLPLRDATLLWQRAALPGISTTDEWQKIWCRTRVNAMDPHSGELLTLITAQSLRSDVLSRRIADDGCDIHACWAIAGANAVLHRPVTHHFVFVQTTPPYLVRVLRMSEDWMARTRDGVEKACRIFAQCLMAGEWPDYDATAAATAATSTAGYDVLGGTLAAPPFLQK